MSSLYDIPLKTITGKTTTLAPYRGDVLLIVNVASHCGFTPQYKALETLYQTYKKQGFQVLGFPCNQFLKQEPEGNPQIQQFATTCYKTSFPLFEKIDVKGPNQSALYAYLAKHIQKKPLFFIPWNFSKILVSQKGEVLRQFLPTTNMKKISTHISQLLNK